MPHPYCARVRTRGFVLLYTLWLLLGAVAVLAAVSALASGRARDLTAEARWLRSNAAAESVVHEILFRLVADGRRALPSLYRQQRSVDNVGLRFSVVAAHGLIDVNTADAAVLQKALSAAAGAGAPGMLEAIRRSGRVHNYDQLLAEDGMSPRRYACLLRYVTLSSGRPAPDSEAASERVRAVLGLDLRDGNGVSTTIAAAASLAGESVRIEVELLETDTPGRRLSVDALITGRIDRPVDLLDWRWLPADGSGEAGGRGCPG